MKEYSVDELLNVYSLMCPLATAAQIQEKAESPDMIALEQWLLDISDDLLRWSVRFINYFDLHGYTPILDEYESREGSRDITQFVDLDIISQRPDSIRRAVYKASNPDELDQDYLCEVFKDGGALSKAFGNYEQRIEQVEMAKMVWRSFTDKKHLLIEAGTGTGKSLGYLIPAILYSVKEGKPVVVSSATINLQEQLIEKDIVAAKKTYPDFPFTSIVLKGRNHYACYNRWRLLTNALHNLEEAIGNDISRQGGFSQKTSIKSRKQLILQYVLYLTYWLINTETGDFDSIRQDYTLHFSIRERIHRLIDSGFKTCISDKCIYKKPCLFYHTRDLGSKCNIVITNHALLFTLFDPANDDAKGFLEVCQNYILDEAHNLEDSITNADLVDVFPELIFDLISNVEHWILKDQTIKLLNKEEPDEDQKALRIYKDKHLELTKSIQNTMFQLNDLVDDIKHSIGKGESIHISYPEPRQESNRLKFENKLDQVYRAITVFLESLIPAINYVKSNTSDSKETSEIAFQIDTNRLDKTCYEVKLALDRHFSTEDIWIRWLDSEDKDLDNWRLWAGPMSAREIGRSFFAKYSSVVLTSATLTVEGDFSFISDRLGLTPDSNNRLNTFQLWGPFDYASQSLVLVPTNVIEPVYNAAESELQRYQIQLANTVIDCTKTFNGGVLALFNNYRDMNAVYEMIMPQLSDYFTVLCQGQDRNRSEISEDFRRDGNAVLLATRSFWEGFDVPGQALRCLILTKLPFNSPSEPIFRARSKFLEDQNENSFTEYSIPLAVIRLTQGFGRLIRTKSDFGCIFILDPRVHSKFYGSKFIRSLPGALITKGTMDYCMQKAKDWMQQRSNPSVAGNEQ